jgi:hypothetical protein
MLTISIEATNPFIENNEANNENVSLISDSSFDSSSNVYEFINVFVRAMLGMSFTKETILNGLGAYADDENIIFKDLDIDFDNFDSDVPEEDFEIDSETL